LDKKHKMMTAGEIAKKMNCTVRTVQYYDQIGLLQPSAYTQGNRRLYSMQDYMVLHQIVSLKELGFTLKEIKEKIMPAESIEQIDSFLNSQEKTIKDQIKKLKKDLLVVSKFRKEMNSINKVDWDLFVEILAFLRSGDEHYWVVKYFEGDVLERIKEKFSKEKGQKHVETIVKFCDDAKVLIEKGILPESSSGQELAKKWWNEILDFTDGDMEMITQMSKMTDENQADNVGFMKKFKEVEEFINKALEIYFEGPGNPL